MTSEFSRTNCANWQQQAHHCLLQGDYHKAATFYEQAIEAEPEVKSHYWYLGLVLLLQGKEAEAQTTWLMAMVDGEAEQVEQWTAELIQVLQAEAERRAALSDNTTAWLIRQHMREIQPTNIHNLLHLIQLAIKQETLTDEELDSLGVIELLQVGQIGDLDADLLLHVLQDVLHSAPMYPSSLEFAKACVPHLQHLPVFVPILLVAANNISHGLQQPAQAARLAELCLLFDADNPDVLGQLATFYQNAGEHSQGIETAKRRCYLLQAEALPARISANHLVIRGLINAGGYWEEACSAMQGQDSLLLSLIEGQPTQLDRITVLRLFTSTFYFPYLRDQPQLNRQIQNQVAHLCQSNIQIYAKEQVERYRNRLAPSQTTGTPAKPLKIGYLSHCLGRHSVGWLARWLFQHHDCERFEIHAYFVNYQDLGYPIQEWYVNQVPHAHKLGTDSREIAEQIYQDEIDILMDLDSLTSDIVSEVMALKPAPIQATWLGWDASGIPAIDYFIADPYVLPESAQDYYTEKIWRLPHTYIAVDGFEVGVPSLRRDELNIPSAAVIYLSCQGSQKRHPDTVRLQMRIIKAVPNSYFLIKGWADPESIQSFFNQLAEEEGVDCSRLRFLPDVPAESIHRANLAIADVVLDTYPYNGATTTLETLWMCVPLVTRVGEQFAARNSYTMMMNAGITEGIAWTDEEYVEWGIRLGKDEALRQQISWKLRQSRQTAPLWNAKQFTREMEKAYQQMWQRWQRIM